jgi:hypothetical protein
VPETLHGNQDITNSGGLVASKAIDLPRKIADHGPDYFEELRIQKSDK